MKKKYLAGLISSILVASVQAQSDTLTTPNSDDNKIETIVVTGQKIDRTLQETPTSVAVATEEKIVNEDLKDMFDILTQLPNVSGKVSGGFNIRGIDAFNVSGGGNSYLTSVYVDGAALPYRMVQKGGFTSWDVAQVEVLRGPQSTLQGRNALAGAIVMRTKQPTYEWEGKGRITLGQFGRKDLAVAFGGELLEDQMAFRFSGEKNSFDGMNDNITRKEKSDFEDNKTYRLKLLWEPKNLEGFSALLTYTKSDNHLGVPWIKYTEEGNYFDNRINDFDAPIFEETDNDIYNLELEYELDDVWTLYSVTTKVDAKYGYEWDSDATPQPLAIQKDRRLDETFSQEIRATFEYDSLKGVVGAYYSSLEVADRASGNRFTSLVSLGVPTLLVAPPSLGGLGLPQPVADQVLAIYSPADPVNLGVISNFFQKVKSSALYMDFTYAMSEQWSIFGGLRYDRESQQNQSENEITVENADKLPNPADYAANPLLQALIGGLNQRLMAMAAAASGDEPLTDDDFSALLPKAGVSYFANDDLSVHFTYQKGYRSGGVGSNIARAQPFTYDPEYTDNYELSLRSVWLDGDLVANANLFYLDWSDQQVRVQYTGNRFDTATENAGNSEVKGFEVELFYSLNDNWTIFAGLGQAKSEFKKFSFNVPGENTVRDLSGRSFALAPEWTANFSATYENQGWFANINANYASSAKMALDPYRRGLKPGNKNFDPENDSRVLINGRIGYEWNEKYALFLNVTNLLDNEYLEVENPGALNVTLGQKRQASVTFTAEF